MVARRSCSALPVICVPSVGRSNHKRAQSGQQFQNLAVSANLRLVLCNRRVKIKSKALVSTSLTINRSHSHIRILSEAIFLKSTFNPKLILMKVEWCSDIRTLSSMTICHHKSCLLLNIRYVRTHTIASRCRSPWATSEGSLHERRGEGGDAASDERDWLWHILLHVKHLFNVPATIVKLDDATTVNHTAANLLKSDAGLFALKASESVRESGTELYGSEADDFGIRFGRWQKDLHGSGLNAVLSSSYNQEEDDPKAGLSWAASGLSFVRGSE